MEDRLSLVSPSLSSRVRSGGPAAARAIAVRAAELALAAVDVDDETRSVAVAVIASPAPSPEALAAATAAVDRLDTEYLDLSDAGAHALIVLRAFARARALSATVAAAQDNPTEAALESLYEAHAALGTLEPLERIVAELVPVV